MSQIKVEGLTFSYPGSYDNIFEDVSFQLDTDWKLGFIGRNGRGKTTFLKLLLGEYPYGGSISASVPLAYFPFPVKDQSCPTEEVLHSVNPEAQNWELIRELSLLGVSEDALERSFDTLSFGEQTKALLAVLFVGESRFLLIDEPTNHLDAEGRQRVSRYLRRKEGFLLVSHDRAFLDGCVDHVLSINKTNIELQRGDFSSWFENKKRQDSSEAAQNEKLKKQIVRLEASAREKAGWADAVEKTKFGTKNSGLRPDRGYIGHKSAKMMQRSKAIAQRRQEAMEEKSQLLRNIEQADALKVSQIPYRAPRLVSLDHVSIVYGEKAVCSDVTFTVERGDRIALRGRNGSGKSSILKLICGQDIPYTGNLQVGGGLKISYVSQDTSFLRGSLSDLAREGDIDESLFKAILRKLDFERVQFEKDMAEFSGGQKKKVLIAKSLCEESNLLVWDEPLNFVDVISRMQIEALLLSYRPTILFVEHDWVFTEKIATKFVSL
ncbi:ribosomal protection-like ABC-F family protein [Oscillibacter sp.]|uniref:ribosomal protection-like ABC-F family protein n=1 Tax=Oscillibacter sp. TaxID=1945593 RepID=UPI0028AF551A|nr:ABC-F type ribosomal protection protein [Oscillibacter sp.]